MSKKTLMVLAFACILLGCGKNSPDSVVVSSRPDETEKAVYEATMQERRTSREAAQERIARLKEELAAARAADAKSDRVKILEMELVQWEAEASQQRAETYQIVRERKLKEQQNVKVGGK